MNPQVALAASYLPAYALLPKKAQRKADEFIRKFRSDPTQSSINYEHIKAAVDKQLRSVRVGDDYRAIVRAPEKGDLYLLLYIDHHDEAYRWAEGKKLEVHPKTGTLQIFDIDQAAAALTDAHDRNIGVGSAPIEEKFLFDAFDDDALFVGGIPRVLLPAVRAVADEEDLDRLLAHLPREGADLLTGLAAGYEYDAVIAQILESAKAPREVAPSVDVTNLVAALEKPSTQADFKLLDEDFDLEHALRYPLDRWRLYLHPSQREFVEAETKGPVRLTGGAGTGKTVVAIHRAAHLVRKVFRGPDDKLLFTTFTKNLAFDIRTQLEKLLAPEELSRIEVVNIDAWATSYLKAQGIAIRPALGEEQKAAWRWAYDLHGVDGYSLAWSRAEWDAVIQAQNLQDVNAYVSAIRRFRGSSVGRTDRRKLWELFSAYKEHLREQHMAEPVEILRMAEAEFSRSPNARRYRSVIVDEAQDFSTEALRLVRALAGPEGPNDLFLAGDAHQRIYGRPVPFSDAGIQVRGRRSRELRLNYRTTGSICRWSVRTLGTKTYDDLDQGTSNRKGYVSLRQGSPPTVRHFPDVTSEALFVATEVQTLLNSGALPEEICIVARTGKLLRENYVPALDQLKIPNEIVEHQTVRPGSVRLATMHRVKGLEFPYVFAAGVCAGVIPYTPTEHIEDELLDSEHELRERCLLYVATSRARDELWVTSYDTPSPFLADIPAVSRRPKRSVATPVRTETEEHPAPPSSPEPAFVSTLPKPAWASQRLERLTLPTRMVNWLGAKGLETVGDLVSIAPKSLFEERNLGRKSVAETRQALEGFTGLKWEEARELVVSPGSSAQELTGWDPGVDLKRPLSVLELEETVVYQLAGRGASILADLVRLHPLELAQPSYLGRQAVAEIRLRLEKELGRRWEEASRLLAGGETDLENVRWGDLKELIPKAVQAEDISNLPLPARMQNYAKACGLTLVSHLIEIPEKTLIDAPNLGRGTIAQSRQIIAQYSDRVEEERRRWCEGLLPSLKDKLSELETIPRMIITRRSGLAMEAETLEEIGATLGITRERVRQIESKSQKTLSQSAAYVEYVIGECDRVTPGGAVRVEHLESDPYFHDLAQNPRALGYFVEFLTEEKYRTLKDEDAYFLTSTPRKKWEDVKTRAFKRARGASYPQPVEELFSMIRREASGVGETLGEYLVELIRENITIVGENQEIAQGYGSSLSVRMEAYLAQQPAPISVNDLYLATGRGGIPESIFYLGRGLVGLEQHFPNFKEWREKVAPVCIALMEKNGPERQWSTPDLLDDLKEEITLPPFFDHYHLCEILKRSEGVTYLGRLRVALPSATEGERIQIHVALSELVQAHGAPLDFESLTKSLRKKLDASDGSILMRLLRFPFVETNPGLYGLVTRDLPGGIEASQAACDALEDVLIRREKGLTAYFAHKEIGQVSSVHSSWTREMCLSVLRSDQRFRLSSAQNVGLDEWETVRVPSRLQIAEEALRRGGGRVTLESISERIEALYGERPQKPLLYSIAVQLHAKVENGILVSASAGE